MTHEAPEFRRQVWQRLKQCYAWALNPESGGEARNIAQRFMAALNRRIQTSQVRQAGRCRLDQLAQMLQNTPTWLMLSGVVLGVIGTTFGINADSASSLPLIQVFFSSLESLAVVAAIALYCKEVIRRQARESNPAQQHPQPSPETVNSNDIATLTHRFPDLALRSDLETSQANLTEINLRGANLRKVNLRGVMLVRADLQGAILREANLQGANLANANLNQAILWEADLRGANLSQANLQGADLYEAKLQGADLSGADLQGAGMSLAKLCGANLSQANLQAAALNGTNLQGANLDQADLREVDEWRDRQLAQARLCQTRLPAGSQLDPNRDCDSFTPSAFLKQSVPPLTASDVWHTGSCPILYDYAKLHRGFLAFPRQAMDYYLACYLDPNAVPTGLPEHFPSPEAAVAAAIQLIDAQFEQTR